MYRVGWDELRSQRYERQIELGLIDSEWELSPRDEDVPAWGGLDEAKRDEMDLRMALYAAMIDRVDQNIGKLVAHLKQTDQLDNTLILFLSDNGACAEGGVLGRGVVLNKKARNKSGGVSYGKAWANASSTPYRLYKHYTHEGGACTPFFMHWPDRIEPQAEWYREPAQLIDIAPTLFEVSGAEYPTEHAGNAITALEGTSLAAAFDGERLDRGGPIFTEHENNAMVRDGRWKLVGKGVAASDGVRADKWELYDMEADGTELNNLIDEQPDLASEYARQWSDWATRVGVYPKKARR